MALTLGRTFTDKVITGVISNAGTSTGANGFIPVPYRGRVTEVGCLFNSLVASAVTLTVLQYTAAGTGVASAVVVTSGTGTFASQVLLEGMTASVLESQYPKISVVQGDVLKFTTSGGTASTISANIYAVIRAEK